MTSPALLVAAPPRVAAWVRAAPDGPVRVLHACEDALHLDIAGRCISITGPGSPGLPNSLRTNRVGEVHDRAVTPYLERGILHGGGRALVTGRFVDVRAPRLDAAWVPKASPVVEDGSPRPHGAGLVASPCHLDATAVPGLVGHGDGLTPAGDDLLCGWLAVHRAAGVATTAVDDAVRRHLSRTTSLSATLLACALAGEVADPVGDYLRALGTSDAAAARARLEAFGQSSGHALADGVDLGLAQLTERASAA